MADTAPQSPDDLFAQAQAIADRMRGQQPAYAPAAPADRSLISLLGEAVGGGASDVAPADREAAGMRALLNFGANLSAASGPSVLPRNFGQILAQGVSGAEQSLGSSAAVSASRLGAQQAYEEKQQELQLNRIKEAIPLLTLQTQMQQAAAAAKIAGLSGAPGASIATVGAPGADTYEGSIAKSEGTTPSTTSTSAGIGGFTEGSWGDYVKANPAVFAGMTPQQILDARNKPEIATPAITWLAQRNAAQLAAAGVQPSGPALTVAHKLGPTAAAAVMQAPANTPLADVLTASIGKDEAAAYLKANPTFTGQTAGGYRGQWANVPDPGFLKPASAPAAPAPYKVASTGATAPPAPKAAPPGATSASTTPPAAPQYPDVTSGDVTIKHPGTFVDFAAKEMAPVPQTEDFNPNLTPAQQAAFAVKAQDLALKRQQIGTLPFADQPKAAAELTAQTAALAADQQNAAQEKAQKAAEATTKFQDTQRAAVQTRYDAAVTAYNEAAKSRFGFHQDIVKSQAEKQVAGNDEMLKPYEIAATQAGQVLPIIALAKQVLPELPTNASPWLADERNRARLESLAPFLPAGWTKATDGADLFAQVMSNIVVQMGANVQSGQTGGREAAYQEFRSMLPTLSQSAEGRERALMFMQEIAQRRLQEAEFLQSYRSNPANRDPTLGVPNMGAARSAMETALPPMLKLPPLRYNPNLPATDPKEAANQVMYRRYFASVPDGGRYIGYGRDEQGAAHPVARTKVKGQPPQIGLE